MSAPWSLSSKATALGWLVICAVLMSIISTAAIAQKVVANSANADEFKVQAEAATVGPSASPKPNVTSFAQALRCMDGLFKNYGAKGVSILIEEIPDATKKMNVGVKDMFMSATSQATRSSRSIRLIPWGGGAVYGGREDILKNASFAVQGSISQFDESMLRKQRDGAICLGPICLGAADSDSFSGLSLDLNMIETEGLTLLPGVTSKNQVLIRRKGRGYDGDLSLKKFGIQYNFTFTSSDGQGQALRTLVELSVIELYGRLLKIPYWSCLGLTDGDPGVASEIEDWWETLRGDIPSLVSYFQVQMQARGLYKGSVDGQLNPELKQAIRAYKVAMGGQDDLTLNADFFRQYLAADHVRLQTIASERLSATTVREVAAVEAVASKPPLPVMQMSGRDTSRIILENPRGAEYVHRRGEAVEFSATIAQAGLMYCYLIDDSRRVTQFFPNPAQPSASVQGGTRINFPGSFSFRLTASRRGLAETVACFLLSGAPATDTLSKASQASDATGIRSAFGSTVSGEGLLHVKVQ